VIISRKTTVLPPILTKESNDGELEINAQSNANVANVRISFHRRDCLVERSRSDEEIKGRALKVRRAIFYGIAFLKRSPIEETAREREGERGKERPGRSGRRTPRSLSGAARFLEISCGP